MPKLSYTTPLRLDFLWANRLLMGKLTDHERKMFFAVFAVLAPKKVYEELEIIDIPLTILKVLSGSQSNEKQLAKDVRKGFKKISKGYSKKTPIPYEFVGIKNGCARFRIMDSRIFTEQEGYHYCKIDLAEIFMGPGGHHKDYHCVPIGWYFLAVVHKYFYDHDAAQADMFFPRCEVIVDDNSVPAKLMVTIGHEELKKVTGYDLYDYTRFPGKTKKRFLAIKAGLPLKYKLKGLENRLFEKKLTERERKNIEASIEYTLKDIRALEKELHGRIDDLEREMHEIAKTIQPLRQPFIDVVMAPGIEVLNRGGMIHFAAIDAWKRPKKRSKEEMEAGIPIRNATKKETYVLINYEMRFLKPGECVVKNPIYDKKGNVIGGTPITKKITNYRNCRIGNEYTLCVDLQSGGNYNQDDLVCALETAVLKALEKPVAESVSQISQKPNNIYLDDIQSIENEEFLYDGDFEFDEKSDNDFLQPDAESFSIEENPFGEDTFYEEVSDSYEEISGFYEDMDFEECSFFMDDYFSE